MAEGPKSMYICLSSDASMQIFPNNSKTHFVNQFPFPLKNRDSSRKFYVRVSSISISTQEHSLPPADYAEIHLQEVEGQRSGRDFVNVVGGFKYPPKSGQNGSIYGTHVFTQAARLPLQFQELQRLEVRITNRDNKQLRLDEGPPTLVWLEITDDMDDRDEFTVICNSLHPNLFPSNTLSHFTAPIPSYMTLDDHEVALLQVTFPAYMTDRKEKALMWINDTEYTYDLSTMMRTSTFINQVSTDLRLGEFGDELRFYISGEHTRFPNRTVMKRKKLDAEDPREIRVHFNTAFLDACGQTNQPRTATYLKPGKMILFEGTANIFNAMPHPVSVLTCNLIEPNIMAAQHAYALQCVPIVHGRGAADYPTVYEPKNLSFHPVKPLPFNSMTFRFLEPDGTLKNLTTHHYGGIQVTLLFRKKHKVLMSDLSTAFGGI